jgi:hypothetical protein
MASAEWIKLGTKQCGFVNGEVELFEKRVYPVGLLNQGSDGYRVLARKCSAGYQCSDIEEPCQWVDADGDGRLYNL